MTSLPNRTDKNKPTEYVAYRVSVERRGCHGTSVSGSADTQAEALADAIAEAYRFLANDPNDRATVSADRYCGECLGAGYVPAARRGKRKRCPACKGAGKLGASVEPTSVRIPQHTLLCTDTIPTADLLRARAAYWHKAASDAAAWNRHRPYGTRSDSGFKRWFKRCKAEYRLCVRLLASIGADANTESIAA